MTRYLTGFLALTLSSGIAAQEREGVIVLSDTVTGNQEQPKVLYIVPWQEANDDTMLNRALITQLQRDLFAHIERPEHQRELHLLEELAPKQNAGQD